MDGLLLASCSFNQSSVQFRQPHLVTNKENHLITTDVIILDFKKAFYSVNHRKRLFKSKHFGINSEMIL